MEAQSLLERRYRVLGRNSPLFYDKPLHLVRGEGVWLYDADGKRYLDAYNNVPHVGHCHPRVVAALSRQAATLNTHTRYLDESVVAYAERLTALFDAELSMAMFCCTGSEANELALRIARDCSGGMGIISTAWAYHGNTAAVMQVSSLFTPPDKRGPYVRTVPVMDPYRDRAGRSDEELATAYADDVKREIDAFAAAGIRFAGLLFCTAFSSEGLPDGPRRIHGEGARPRARGGRVVHRRRGAGGIRPPGQPHVGTSTAGRRPRHRHARQAHGQRPSARRGHRAPRLWSTASPAATCTSIPSAAIRSPPRSACRCSM